MANVLNTLQTGNHAGRPTSGLAYGSLYSCTTHSLIYQTTDDGATWVTWGTLGVGDATAHIADASAAHAASAVSFSPTGTIAATDVQAAIAELGTEDAAVHIADTSSAHVASSIGFTPNGSIAATDVQAAIQEVRDEATGGGTAGTSILLTYDLAADITNQAITAGTYFDMIANQNITVASASSIVEVAIRGLCFFNDNQANEYIARINIDSAGTPVLHYFGGAVNAYPTPTLNARLNPLAGGSIFISGLTAAVHTIKVQITTSVNNDHLYCRASTVGPPTAGAEYLTVQVIEHKN